MPDNDDLISRRIAQRLDLLGAAINELGRRMTWRLDSIDARIRNLEGKAEVMDSRIQQAIDRIKNFDTVAAGLQATNQAQAAELQKAREEIDNLKAKVDQGTIAAEDFDALSQALTNMEDLSSGAVEAVPANTDAATGDQS